tara:strand:+ start:131 stop:952 length:822 start_codon:yes stop_codon:yes gene_type:complete
MNTIAYVAYREWAFKILKKLNNKNNKIVILTPNKKIKSKIPIFYIKPNDNNKILSILRKNKVKVVMFYGWSWIISKQILDNYLCLCLHPSKLPYFRGGSPIQNQIIQNVKQSAVTVFKMNDKIDGGDIYKQKKFSLNGNLNKIFKRIILIGSIVTNDFINDLNRDQLNFYKQKKIKTIYKRRKSEESKIDLKKFKKKSYNYFFNFVRMLQDPYPNPFFEIKKKRVYIYKIQKIKITLKRYKKSLLDISIKKGIFIKLKDSYCKILSGKVLNIK